MPTFHPGTSLLAHLCRKKTDPMSGHARSRQLIDQASRPAFPNHVRLQHDRNRNAWVVLAPERVYWPDETSVAILNLCDGKATAGEIARTLSQEFDAPLAEVEPDVLAFLQEWSDKLLIRCEA